MPPAYPADSNTGAGPGKHHVALLLEVLLVRRDPGGQTGVLRTTVVFSRRPGVGARDVQTLTQYVYFPHWTALLETLLEERPLAQSRGPTPA